MLVVLLGTASALLYGAGDFFGGAASRTHSALQVTLGALAIAALLDAPILAAPGTVWSAAALLTGALGGVCGGIGTWSLYAALARGPVGVVAPAVALIAALLPTLWGLLRGEATSALTGIAMLVVVIAGVLLSLERRPDLRPDGRTVLLILGAGVPYGAYVVVIGQSPVSSGVIPLEADLVTGSFLLLAVVASRRAHDRAARSHPDRRGFLFIFAAGLSQGFAGALLVFALHLPAIAIVGALSALYPVGTVVLGFVVLRERVRPFQAAGLVLAVAGVGLLAWTHS